MGTALVFLLAIVSLLGAGKIERIKRKEPSVAAAT
jgi:hypothetical protein